jgi:hypothetical protein
MDLAFWRDVSIIWLSIQLFVLLAVPLAILFLAVKGMQFVHTKLPPIFHKAQDISNIVRTKTDEISHYVAAPVIRGHGWANQAGTALRTLWHDRTAR